MNSSPGDRDYISGAFDDFGDSVREFVTDAPSLVGHAWESVRSQVESIREDSLDGLSSFLDGARRLAAAPQDVSGAKEVWHAAYLTLVDLEEKCSTYGYREHFPARNPDSWMGDAATTYRDSFDGQHDFISAIKDAVKAIVDALDAVINAQETRDRDYSDQTRGSVTNVITSTVVGAFGGPVGLFVGLGGSIGFTIDGIAGQNSVLSAFRSSVLGQVGPLNDAIDMLPG